MLPTRIQKQARDAYRLFKNNPAHPGLRFKQIQHDPPIFSVRVGIAYRTVGILSQDTIVWYWIGSNTEYDLLLKLL